MGFLLSEPPLHPEHLPSHRVEREHLSLGDRTAFNSRQEAFKDFNGSQHKEAATFHLYNKLLITAGWTNDSDFSCLSFMEDTASVDEEHTLPAVLPDRPSIRLSSFSNSFGLQQNENL